jgi:hypothetical protein
VTPEERFLVEKLGPDTKGRPGWGLRDIVTGELARAGREIDRYGTPDQARMHRRRHWSQAQRADVAAHIEQFTADAAHRRDGALGPRREQRPEVEPPEVVWSRAATAQRDSA